MVVIAVYIMYVLQAIVTKNNKFVLQILVVKNNYSITNTVCSHYHSLVM